MCKMRRLTSLLLFNVVVIFSVTVAQEPSLTIQPGGDIRRSIGDNILSSCTANVDNEELISEMRWKGPGEEEIPNIDNTIQVLDGGSGQNQKDLYIENFRKQDVGIYTCEALFAGNKRLEATMNLTSYKDIDFGDTEVKQTPAKGTDAKIRCMVTADPPPLVDWLKDGKAFSGDARHIIQADGVLIKNITEDDEGVYRCRARVSSLGQLDFRNIQVEVYDKPEITFAPQNVSGAEEKEASFQCVAKGKPPPTYSWTDPQNRVLSGVEGYFVDDQTGELKILVLKPEHTGTYRCTAKNAAGEVWSEAYLKVLTKPRLEKSENITVDEEGKAELSCTFSGHPAPEVVFQKETIPERFITGVNEDLRIAVTQEKNNKGQSVGTMKIEGVSRKDDGLYSCTGVSEGGVTVVWVHITVQFKPSFEDQTQDKFWSWDQKPVNISCLATSIPNATIQWYLREDQIRMEDYNFRVISQGPQGILQVTPMDGSYYDTYTCKATNTIGVTLHEVALREVQKPGPVSSTSVVKKSATTVEWSIQEPRDIGEIPILGYNIQFRLENTGWDKSELKYFPKGSTYLIDHLIPENTYVFKFAARNDVGDGEWSGEKSVTMPKRSVPEEPLIYSVEPDTVKSIPYSNHYELQWQVPLDNGEEIDHFLITYYKVVNNTKGGGYKPMGPQEEVQVPHPGKSTYKMEDLNSNTMYKIELRAHNKLGNSRPAEALIRTSYDLVKDSDWQGVGAAVGSTSLYIHFVFVWFISSLVNLVVNTLH